MTFIFFLWKENKFQEKDDTILLMFGFECLTGQKYATEKYAGTKKKGGYNTKIRLKRTKITIFSCDSKLHL